MLVSFPETQNGHHLRWRQSLLVGEKQDYAANYHQSRRIRSVTIAKQETFKEVNIKPTAYLRV